MTNTNVGMRLAEERKRLGYSQTEFSEAAGSGRASQVNYETGKRFPDAEYLEAAAKLGVDVQYVLTGVRSMNLYEVAEQGGHYKTAVGGKRTIDPELLKAVIAGVEEYLEDSEQELNPDDKAELVLLLLDLVTSETVQREGAVISLAGKMLEFKRHGGNR